MRSTFVLRLVPALVFCLPFASSEAQTAAPSSDSSVAVVIATILTKKSAAPKTVVQKEEVILREGGVRKPITVLIPTRGDRASLQLAIIVDEASGKDTGSQFQTLKDFILAQPPTTAVGIFYALGSNLRSATQFTTDHEKVVSALRPPLGTFGNFASPYAAVSELISKWPVTMARREVLLLTPGFDLIHHELHSSDLQATIEQAQLSGIPVHAILLNAPGRLSLYSEVGRSNLTQLADETGGAALVEALIPPLRTYEQIGGTAVRETFPTLNLSPVLKALSTTLDNQYFLVWNTAPSKNKGGELRKITLRAEDTNLRIVAPPKAFVP